MRIVRFVIAFNMHIRYTLVGRLGEVDSYNVNDYEFESESDISIWITLLSLAGSYFLPKNISLRLFIYWTCVHLNAKSIKSCFGLQFTTHSDSKLYSQLVLSLIGFANLLIRVNFFDCCFLVMLTLLALTSNISSWFF